MPSFTQKPLEFLGEMKRQAEVAACASPIYNWFLAPKETPLHLSVQIADPWPGQSDVGRMMTHGLLMKNGLSIKIDENMWTKSLDSPARFELLHGFTWLRDLRAAGGDAPRKLARVMVEGWLDEHDRWNPKVWRADLIGQRLTMWLSFYDFFCSSAEEHFQKKYFSSIARQARHLARNFPAGLSGHTLLSAAQGLIYAGLCLPNRDDWIMQGFDVVLKEIPKQIRKDGTHISGSPETTLKVAQIFLDLRYALHRANLPVPQSLQNAIEKLAPVLRFFTYPDRKLALFHGGQESDIGLIESVLSQIKNSAQKQSRTIEARCMGGFERAMLGRSVLMIDTSSVPESPYDRSYHSAPLSFEFSHGRDRIFTNCGGHPYREDWRQGLRHTAAHNTLTLDGQPVHPFGDEGQILRSHGPICCVRRDVKDACLIDVSHDAFKSQKGIEHQRRFFLSNLGQDFRGEDTLVASIPLSQPVDVAIRFHLHPRVQISAIGDKNDVTFVLPSGTTWTFFCDGANLKLENSIFLGSGLKPQKSQQIVLTTRMASDKMQVKWALQKIQA